MSNIVSLEKRIVKNEKSIDKIIYQIESNGQKGIAERLDDVERTTSFENLEKVFTKIIENALNKQARKLLLWLLGGGGLFVIIEIIKTFLK